MKREEFTVLVVDDDELARDAVASILLKEGYPVLTAGDGLEAIKTLRVNKVGLVITDLKMPRVDGLEVLRYTVKNHPDTMVVLITAYGTIEVALEAIREGAYDYLAKPFKMEEIVFLANKAFNMASTYRELKELKELLQMTYRDIGIAEKIAKTGHPELIANWIERIEMLKNKGLLSEEEVKILRERLIMG